MAAGSFQVGQRFARGDIAHRLLRQVGSDAWVVEDLATGSFREETSMSLLTQWSSGSLRFYDPARGSASPLPKKDSALHQAFEDAYRQSYPDTLWKRAQAKLIFVRKLEGAPITEGPMTALIQEVWEEGRRTKEGWPFKRPPHFTTVAAWIRVYRVAARDIRALIDRHAEKGNRESRLGEAVEAIADDVIATRYMTLERRTTSDVLKDVRGLVAMQNLGRLESEKLPRPSLNFLKRRIAEIPPYDRYVARYGKRLADIKFRAAGAGVLAEKPLERACIDHCRINLMVVDEERGLPLGRPWLTLILDEKTRYILGFYLGFDEPSVVSVARAVRHALMPKMALLKDHPYVVNEWDAWGIFTTLVADNGLELHGTALEHAIEHFGIQLQFCPRKKPWYKGKIERFFGTFTTGLLDAIPGKTFLNIFEKGDYDPAKHAVVTLSTLRKIILMWIVDVYHQERHRGLRAVPAQAWRNGIQGVDRWLPPSSLATDSAFSRKVDRRLTHKGIEFDCLFYNSPDLRRLREQHGSEIDVEARVADDDLGAIVVIAPDGRQLIRVPALDQAYANGLTRWQHTVCKRYQRRLWDDESRDISLFAAKERIRALIREDMKLLKRGSRKRQGRFMEGSECASQPAQPAPAAECVTAPICTSAAVTAHPIPACKMLQQDDDLPTLSSRRMKSPAEAQHV